jgi:hypothetical protein
MKPPVSPEDPAVQVNPAAPAEADPGESTDSAQPIELSRARATHPEMQNQGRMAIGLLLYQYSARH